MKTMIEFNQLLLLLHMNIFFIILCYKLWKLVQFSLTKVSQMLLKDMVEFNHVIFLLYPSIFDNSVL